tara:strand:+ start:703 stop:1386 length:684 start_codon:yes stop_codon:yes gene_type:complete
MGKIAIIPARGGSKRIPRKNLLPFIGKPIISYSITTAISSGLFDKVIVSTDDEEIKDIAEQYGAEVILRSENNSKDHATTVDVLLEIITHFLNKNIYFDSICCLYPTSPLITSNLIKLAYASLEGYDSLICVSKYKHPIERSLEIHNSKIKYTHPKYISTRTQDLSEKYYDTGQFYLIKPNSLLDTKRLVTNNSKAFILSELEFQDIDTYEDFKLTEIKYKNQNEIQ